LMWSNTQACQKNWGIIYSYLFTIKKEIGQALWTWFHMAMGVANASTKLKFEICKLMCMKLL
jgi:hypothetical protein